MKTVKYFLLARLLKLIFQFCFVLVVWTCSFNIYTSFFSNKTYLSFGDITIGSRLPGHQVHSNLQLDIPDTVTYYNKNLVTNTRTGSKFNYKAKATDTIKEQVINEFINFSGSEVKIFNEIDLDNRVIVRAISTNRLHNLFWFIGEQIDLVFYGLFLLVLIKLTNRYMDDDIFMPRTFKLFAFLGILILFKELLNFLISIINSQIIQNPVLYTHSKFGSTSTPTLSMSIFTAAYINFENIAIGVLIILLSQIIKQAILTKQEQDLTI